MVVQCIKPTPSFPSSQSSVVIWVNKAFLCSDNIGCRVGCAETYDGCRAACGDDPCATITALTMRHIAMRLAVTLVAAPEVEVTDIDVFSWAVDDLFGGALDNGACGGGTGDPRASLTVTVCVHIEIEADDAEAALTAKDSAVIVEAHRAQWIFVGTELERLITKLGFKAAAGCKCKQHIREMNVNGPEWCSANINLIVEWLREEAQRAGLHFLGQPPRF